MKNDYDVQKQSFVFLAGKYRNKNIQFIRTAETKGWRVLMQKLTQEKCFFLQLRQKCKYNLFYFYFNFFLNLILIFKFFYFLFYRIFLFFKLKKSVNINKKSSGMVTTSYKSQNHCFLYNKHKTTFLSSNSATWTCSDIFPTQGFFYSL